MINPYSAQPSMLGYIYQIRYALYLLISRKNPDTKVAIEFLDDVSIENSDGVSMVQLKHHRNAVLTDLSSDIWKTIRIWSDYLRAGTIDNNTFLILATTASLPSNKESLAYMLRPESNFNRATIVEKLDALAKNSKNEGLKEAFQSYLSLTSTQKELLVGLIQIICEEPNIDDIVTKIKEELNQRDEDVDPIYETLEGWWFSRAIEHLSSKETEQITRIELKIKLNDIRDQYVSDSLPIDFAGIDPSDDYAGPESIFVRQLKILTPDPGRIKHAIRDYFRAVEQRSRWARYNLLRSGEIEIYEKRLLEEWGIQQSILKDELPDWADSEAAMQQFGKKILKWVETEANIPIRPRVSEPYVTRGSYHILANKPQPSVWWHPMFVERLKALLDISETHLLSLWEKRPLEIANLLNPPFCALLFREVVKSYETTSTSKAMPFVLSPLILPVLLQTKIRELLPSRSTTSLHAWIQENPQVLVGFAEVTNDLSVITREALTFAITRKIIKTENEIMLKSVPRAKTGNFAPNPESGITTSEAEEILNRAKFLGRWYARAGKDSNIYAWWGVRP